MTIKGYKPDPQPEKVFIAHNGDTRFLIYVADQLKQKWGIRRAYFEENLLMPRNTAIIYDKHDQILVKEMDNGEIGWKRIDKQEREDASLKRGN